VIQDHLRDAVLGRPALDVRGAWSAMVAAIRNLGRPGVVSTAIAAVDLALWDLAARLCEVPLVELLGGGHDGVPVYGSGGFTTYDVGRLRDQLAGWVDAGMSQVKMKVGTEWGRCERDDVDRVAAARAAIGDGPWLFVDANGAYDRKQAVRLAHEFAAHGVTWFEEPVSSDDLTGLHAIRRMTDLDVAAGEYGYRLFDFEQLCEHDAVDVLQADVTRCAGITEWLRVAAVAHAHGLEISGHCAPSMHLHVACAAPNLRHLEYFHDHTRIERLLFDGVVDQVDGVLRPDRDRPGNGLELRRTDAARFARGELAA
jgi:L-alanine-DL-glutamate epimerase-like enolase superfamily enzyme